MPWKARAPRPKARRNGYGVSRIKRDSYSNTQVDWWTIRREVFTRDGGKCKVLRGGLVCNRVGKHVHHIVSLNRGGRTIPSNLITVCQDCHEARHNHMRRGK